MKIGNKFTLPSWAWIAVGLLAGVVFCLLPLLVQFIGNSIIYIWIYGRFTYTSSLGVLLLVLILFGMVVGFKESGK